MRAVEARRNPWLMERHLPSGINTESMEMITKNIGKGERITDLRDIKRLAEEGKSVIWQAGFATTRYFVRPAAFFLSWQLRMMINYDFYYTVKI